MEILEAYDLTGGLRAAAALAGCDHKTVAHYVALRDAGRVPDQRLRRAMVIDPFLAKVEEWVDRSNGRIRADVVHEKLMAMGFTGAERTTRRAVAAVRKQWQVGNRRVFRPWVPEPGLWLQFDWGHGPRIGRRGTLLFCAWLAWSRFRVVLPVWDRTLPSLLGCLDATLRVIGGAPTYALTEYVPRNIFGQQLVRDPEPAQRIDQCQTDGSALRARNYRGDHRVAGVVVDPGDDLDLGAVGEHDPADDVHLPQFHRPVPLPTLVVLPATSTRHRVDQPVPDEYPVDRGQARKPAREDRDTGRRRRRDESLTNPSSPIHNRRMRRRP